MHSYGWLLSIFSQGRDLQFDGIKINFSASRPASVSILQAVLRANNEISGLTITECAYVGVQLEDCRK